MSNKSNYNTLSETIEETGVGEVGETIPDGKIHRFHTYDDKPGRTSGWYIDFGNYGSFGSWKTGKQYKFCNGRLSKAERKILSKKVKQTRKKEQELRQKKHDEAASTARQIWDDATDAITLDNENNPVIYVPHSYIKRKKITPFKAKVYGGYLIIPMYYSGSLVSIQKIDVEGEKRFQYGGRVKGCFCPIGKLKECIYICEGYATGCSLYEYTGQAVAVAFNASNLYEVALEIRRAFPDTKIIIAADNDVETAIRTGINPGIESAVKAAAPIDAQVIFPSFLGAIDGTDFNDYLTQGGIL